MESGLHYSEQKQEVLVSTRPTLVGQNDVFRHKAIYPYIMGGILSREYSREKVNMKVMRTRRIGTTDALKRVVTGLLLAGLSGAVAQQPVEAQTIQAKKPKPPTTATIVDLGALSEGSSMGFGVNNSGQVTGSTVLTLIMPGQDGSPPILIQKPRAFLYSNGVMTGLGTLVSEPSDKGSQGLAVNDSGQVTGWSENAAGRRHAFLYSNGVMTDLGTLSDGTESEGNAVNNAGQVAGVSNTLVGGTGDRVTHGFLYSNGVMTDLGTLGGANSIAWAINNNGQVAGWSGVSSNSELAHAFVYRNGVMTMWEL
jgi:probable HAF family extracellular repeat protein